MPKVVLPERQRLALLYLLEHPDDDVLIDDIARVIRDTKPLARTAMRALVEKGLARETKFKGMVHSFHAPHMSPHKSYRPTAKAKRSQIETAATVSGKERTMPTKAPRHRTAASRNAAVETALLEFVDAIESTGGVMRNPTWSGHFVPKADEDWIDLGEAYMGACKALDRKPKVEA
jgi:hypothetical protein